MTYWHTVSVTICLTITVYSVMIYAALNATLLMKYKTKIKQRKQEQQQK